MVKRNKVGKVLSDLMKVQKKAQDDFDEAVKNTLDPFRLQVMSALSLDELFMIRNDIKEILTLEVRDSSIEYHLFYSFWAKKYQEISKLK